MRTLTLILMIALAGLAAAAEEAKLWQDGRITPEQPFKAKVIGVIPGWGGDSLILKEIDEPGKYLMAALIMHQFIYRVMSDDEIEKMKNSGVVTFISPGVDVERFSWSMGIHELGRHFGDKDFVRQWYEKSKPVQVIVEE